MSKYEQVVAMKAEVSALKEQLAKLESAEPTVENLEKVNAIKTRAKEIERYTRQFCRKYGMVA